MDNSKSEHTIKCLKDRIAELEAEIDRKTDILNAVHIEARNKRQLLEAKVAKLEREKKIVMTGLLDAKDSLFRIASKVKTLAGDARIEKYILLNQLDYYKIRCERLEARLINRRVVKLNQRICEAVKTM